MKKIFKWILMSIFIIIVGVQALGLFIYVGLPLIIGGAIVLFIEKHYEIWRIGKMQKEIEEMELWNKERDRK